MEEILLRTFHPKSTLNSFIYPKQLVLTFHVILINSLKSEPMPKILTFLFLTLFVNISYAYDPVTIAGKAPFAANQVIRIYQYDDLITYRKVLLKSEIINKDGDFKTTLNLTRPTYIMFSINFLESELYVEPQKKYEIHFEFLTKFENPAEISAKEIPMLTIVDNDHFEELNQRINILENAISQFLIRNDNFKKIYYRSDQKQLDSLKALIYSDWGSNLGDYFRTYQKYTFATYENIIYSKYPDSAFVKYFNERNFELENTAFMIFFNTYFEKYYDNPISKIPTIAFLKIINEKPELPKLLDLMGKDPALKNEIIREMVLIKMLNNAFSDERFHFRNTISLLYELAETTKFPDHKKMAMNSLASIKSKVSGKSLLNYSLKNINGSMTKLAEFKDKYLYIHFFSTDCNSCIREMYGIQKLLPEYADSVQFISVSLDMNTAKLFHFVNKYTQFNWPIVHFANNFEMVEEYGLSGLPLNMIIDKEGNIISFPAPNAEGTLSQMLNIIFKDKYRHKTWFDPGHSRVPPKK